MWYLPCDAETSADYEKNKEIGYKFQTNWNSTLLLCIGHELRPTCILKKAFLNILTACQEKKGDLGLNRNVTNLYMEYALSRFEIFT